MRKISLLKLKLIARIIVLAVRVENLMLCDFQWNWWYLPNYLDFCWRKMSKVESRLYLGHLQNEVIPLVEELFPNKDFIFIHDSAPIHHERIVQNCLKESLSSWFIKNVDWVPNFPAFNALCCFFWDKAQQNWYEGCHCKPLSSIEGLKRLE